MNFAFHPPSQGRHGGLSEWGGYGGGTRAQGVTFSDPPKAARFCLLKVSLPPKIVTPDKEQSLKHEPVERFQIKLVTAAYLQTGKPSKNY